MVLLAVVEAFSSGTSRHLSARRTIAGIYIYIYLFINVNIYIYIHL